MRIILLSIIACCLNSASAQAQDTINVIEIFTANTSSSCLPPEDEFHNADGSHKENIKGKHEHPEDKILNIFNEIIAQNPNVIGLQYYQQSATHSHDENGNDQPVQSETQEEIQETDPSLVQDMQKHRNQYYFNNGFLDEYTDAQMIINGKYKASGSHKDTVHAALALSKTQHMIKPITLKLNGDNLETSIPESNSASTLSLTLVGYTKTTQIEDTKRQNTVTSIKRLSDWNGIARQETISIADMNAKNFAIIAQDTKTGKIYAAGKIEQN